MKQAEEIIGKLKSFFKEGGFQKAVVGMSGGVDSSLVTKLAVMALGKEKVTGILMPHEGLSSDHSVSDAKAWAEALGIEHHIISITNFVAQYKKLPWPEGQWAKLNVQPRIRATILYHYANSHQGVVLGTGNKTELTLGYFTKYVDGAVDILPIGRLYKSEVWKMAKELELPDAIIHKTPSAELQEGHTDEGEIGVSYPEIDVILKKFETGGLAETENEKMLEARIKANRHKLEMPKVI